MDMSIQEIREYVKMTSERVDVIKMVLVEVERLEEVRNNFEKAMNQWIVTAKGFQDENERMKCAIQKVINIYQICSCGICKEQMEELQKILKDK